MTITYKYCGIGTILKHLNMHTNNKASCNLNKALIMIILIPSNQENLLKGQIIPATSWMPLRPLTNFKYSLLRSVRKPVYRIAKEKVYSKISKS